MSNFSAHNGSQSIEKVKDQEEETDNEYTTERISYTPSSEESQLINDCIKGKRQAQRTLYEQFAPKMYAIAMRYAKTTLEADDILQESFINVFKHINTFARDCPIEFWIRRIVINQALKTGRNKFDKASKEEVSDINYNSEENLILDHFELEELLQIIRRLPEGFQQIFNLYAIEGYKHKEIAEMLEISVGTSKSQYARARAQLQEMLLKEDESYEQLRK
ncbi:RNA polymerase sigma factor [Bernardetia sp.]|uniref:RNA polymerase sigma factor n=1 Tax=Bernardetia sp. TaxID=1937974 RepID=UPI0025BCAE98|nr:RNA polymerase sigma factor [Bernardetia sp.]